MEVYSDSQKPCVPLQSHSMKRICFRRGGGEFLPEPSHPVHFSVHGLCWDEVAGSQDRNVPIALFPTSMAAGRSGSIPAIQIKIVADVSDTEQQRNCSAVSDTA